MDISLRLQGLVRQAIDKRQMFRIEGGNSKAFLGRPVDGEVLSLREHHGIVSYEPTELVITCHAGTTLKELEQTLAEQRQMLPFEPPHFGEQATLGGTIACGLAGPRRPFSGAARDFVLGCRVLTGKGDIIHFGGEVIKNVAGYDVSRLMTGAFGTLGVLLDVSLKVLPLPEHESTVRKTCSAKEALHLMNSLATQPTPLSAACHDGENLYLRFSGSRQSVEAACKKIPAEVAEDGQRLWQQIREHRHSFFSLQKPLWRLSLAASSPPLTLAGETFLDWGGAQRWLYSDESATRIRDAVSALGGHATLYRNPGEESEIFHPLTSLEKQFHLNLKQVFDPFGLLNYGRMYEDL